MPKANCAVPPYTYTMEIPNAEETQSVAYCPQGSKVVSGPNVDFCLMVIKPVML